MKTKNKRMECDNCFEKNNFSFNIHYEKTQNTFVTAKLKDTSYFVLDKVSQIREW